MLLAQQRHLRQPAPNSNHNKAGKKKKGVHFPTTRAAAIQVRTYDFDWELERAYWFSREELNGFKTQRLTDAATLRKERGIEIASRDDADALTEATRDLFIHDKITHALDVRDDGEISIQGIEHFVFPVLQKEMVRQRNELKKTVLGRVKDPRRLAEESATCSAWARDVASERGMKYIRMKRSSGRGGGLLAMMRGNKMAKARLQISGLDGVEEAAAAKELGVSLTGLKRSGMGKIAEIAAADAEDTS